MDEESGKQKLESEAPETPEAAEEWLSLPFLPARILAKFLANLQEVVRRDGIG